MLPSTLKCLYSVEPVRMYFSAKQPCTNDTVCNAAVQTIYKESFQVHWDNSIPLFLHAGIYLEVSLFCWTSQNAFSHETAVYKWMEKKWDTVIPVNLKKTLCKWDIYVPLVTKGLKYMLGTIYDLHQKSCLCRVLEVLVTVGQYHVKCLNKMGYDGPMWHIWTEESISYNETNNCWDSTDGR